MTMEEMIRTLPGQYRWAHDIEVPSVPASQTVLVCGMGGSGIAGDVAAAAAGGVFTHKSYGLPAWTAAMRPLVVAVSYSGNTEETLSSTSEAVREGLQVVAVSTGGRLEAEAAEHGWPFVRIPEGLQPRAAFGYLAGTALRIVQAVGLMEEPGLEEAAVIVDELLGHDLDGPGVHLAEDLADGLSGKLAVVLGGTGPSAVAAYRWKTQINENAKSPAYVACLPEADHNDIVGWSTLGSITRRLVGVVALRDGLDDPRLARRFEPTLRAIREDVSVIGEVWAQGHSPMARIAGLAAVGDLVSVAIARNAGVDPIPVEPIETLKRTLSQENS